MSSTAAGQTPSPQQNPAPIIFMPGFGFERSRCRVGAKEFDAYRNYSISEAIAGLLAGVPDSRARIERHNRVRGIAMLCIIAAVIAWNFTVAHNSFEVRSFGFVISFFLIGLGYLFFRDAKKLFLALIDDYNRGLQEKDPK